MRYLSTSILSAVFLQDGIKQHMCVTDCASTFAAGAGKKASACQCMGLREAELWQCRSKLARGLIVRRCLTHFAAGFKAWAYVLLTSLACLFGLWSLPPTMHRWAAALVAWLSAQARQIWPCHSSSVGFIWPYGSAWVIVPAFCF